MKSAEDFGFAQNELNPNDADIVKMMEAHAKGGMAAVYAWEKTRTQKPKRWVYMKFYDSTTPFYCCFMSPFVTPDSNVFLANIISSVGVSIVCVITPHHV